MSQSLHYFHFYSNLYKQVQQAEDLEKCLYLPPNLRQKRDVEDIDQRL